MKQRLRTIKRMHGILYMSSKEISHQVFKFQFFEKDLFKIP